MGCYVVWFIALTALLFTHLLSTVFYQPSYKHSILIESLFSCSHKIIAATVTGTLLTSCALGHGGKFYIIFYGYKCREIIQSTRNMLSAFTV